MGAFDATCRARIGKLGAKHIVFVGWMLRDAVDALRDAARCSDAEADAFAEALAARERAVGRARALLARAMRTFARDGVSNGEGCLAFMFACAFEVAQLMLRCVLRVAYAPPSLRARLAAGGVLAMLLRGTYVCWARSFWVVPMNDGMAQGRLVVIHAKFRALWRDPRVRALLPWGLRAKVACHPKLAPLRGRAHARTRARLARALAHMRALARAGHAYVVDELILEREIAHYDGDARALEAARAGFARRGFARHARETREEYVDSLDARRRAGGGGDEGHPARHHHLHALTYLPPPSQQRKPKEKKKKKKKRRPRQVGLA